MKKSIQQTLLSCAIILALSLAFTSCDDILGEWDRPAPAVVTPSTDSEPTPTTDPNLSTPLTIEAIVDGTHVSFVNKASGDVTYKVDGGVAQTIPSGETGDITLSAGGKVAFYGDNATYYNVSTSANSSIGNVTNDCYVYGNIMSLISSSDFATATKLSSPDTFYGLFAGNEYIKNHPSHKLVLPATTLTNSCYASMFFNCSKLTEAPELPAETLASYCYDSMFVGCTGLTTAPELPAETLAPYCYNSMFANCTGLTTAPELPATTLANSCYIRMFSSCTKLSSITCKATGATVTGDNLGTVDGTSSFLLGAGTAVTTPTIYVPASEIATYQALVPDGTGTQANWKANVTAIP